MEVFSLWQVLSREVVKYCGQCMQGHHHFQKSHWSSVLLDISNAKEISSDFGDLTSLLELT